MILKPGASVIITKKEKTEEEKNLVPVPELPVLLNRVAWQSMMPRNYGYGRDTPCIWQ